MKKYIIEAMTTKIERLEIEANSRKEAIELARQIDGPQWEEIDQGQKWFVFIS